MKRIFLFATLVVMLFSNCGCSNDTFTLWQIPSRTDTIGNIYVIRTSGGKLIVMDGGMESEKDYLRGFIDALGGKVDTWFVSHPHDDHISALTRILEDPDGLVIDRICHSRFTEELIMSEGEGSQRIARRFYAALDSARNVEVVDCHCGDQFEIDGVNFKILSEKNPEMLTSYNDQSMSVKVWDDHKSVVFLGDLGPVGGRKLMESEYMKDVDCDYLQMSHHGQAGCDKEFYDKASFRACLWPTPSWVYNNDSGKGFNTGRLKTIEVREWMKEKGITEHYISYEGLVQIR